MPLTVIAYVILYFGGIWKAFTGNPIWGLWSYTLALYASPNHNWFGSYLPDLRWSLLAALCTFLSIFMNKNPVASKGSWINNGAAKILIAYTIWMWVQIPWALSFEMHLEGSILMTKYLVLFYIIYTVLNTDEDYFKFTLFNILGGFYISKCVLDYSVGGRVEGVGGPGINDANSLGMHLSVVLIFSGLMLLKKNTIFSNSMYWAICKGIIFMATIFIANAVVQTISRSAVLGIIAAGVVLFIINHKAFKKKFYLYLVLAFMGLLYLAPYTFWNRVETIIEAAQGGDVEVSAYSRLVIAKAQLEMFKENIFGHGHRGTIMLSSYYISDEYLTRLLDGGRGRASHCTFLTAMVEQGIPGAILFWFMVFWVIISVLSFKKDDIAVYLYVMAIAASLTAIFVAGFFVDYLKAEIQIYCLAMLASLKEHTRIKTVSNASE